MRHRLADKVYRLILRFYPREFRERFGTDMASAYHAARLDARQRGRAGGMEFWFGVITDGLVRAPVEHLHMTMSDLRYAARGLMRTPVFTIVAILTIALGIGANAAIFSAVRAVALRPLGLTDAERLVRIWEKNDRLKIRRFAVSVPNYVDWRAQSTVFEELGAWRSGSTTLTTGGEPQRLDSLQATATVLPLLGVQPMIGRNFLPEEDRPGGAHVALLFESVWRERFGANPNLVGQSITLDGLPFVVIGIVPEGNFPSEAKVMVPLAADMSKENRANHMMSALGRLRKGVTLDQAQKEMDGVADRLARTYADDRDWGVTMSTFYDWIVPRSVRTGLYTLLGSVVVVLLIACSNVANLMLARAALRRRELAVRLALGASRLRLVRHVFTESLLVSVAGGVAGLMLAWWCVPLLRVQLATALPRAEDIRIDGPVLWYSAAITLLTGIAFGVLPSIWQSGTDITTALKEGGRGGGARQQSRARQILVVGQVALATLLVAAGALLLQTFHHLQQVDLGFDRSRVTTAKIGLPDSRYPTDVAAQQFYERLLAGLKATPGIEAVGLSSGPPFGGGNTGMSLSANGANALGSEPVQADWRIVSDAYFTTLSIPILRGRPFNQDDKPDARPLSLILSDGLARRFWPNDDPIGRQVTLGNKAVCRIVGVVADVHNTTIDAPPDPTMYFPTRQLLWSPMSIVTRTSQSIEAAPLVRRQVAVLDPELAVFDVSTMATLLETNVAQPRLTAWLVGLFAAIALLLAALGVYGLLAYLVAQRTREIGVRMALGANGPSVLRLVLGHALRLTASGVAVGTVGALLLGPWLASLLFGVTSRDATTLAGVALILMTIAILASYVPARRATRVDPLVALRSE